jgi:RNA polymerase sigma-70 factor (ECF subfamily)
MMAAAPGGLDHEHGGALGPPPSFDQVYDEYFDFVWRSLRRLGVGTGVIDDAVQEVFLVVHRRLPEFRGESSLKTWLFGIALNVAQHVARTLARKGADELPDTIFDPGAETPQDRAAQNEAIRTLYRLLDRLDADKRAVFVMAELEQLTAKEISIAVGAPLNTVYSRLRGARRDFEAALRKLKAKEAWRP